MQQILMIGSPVTHVLTPSVLNSLLHQGGEDAEVITQEVLPAQLERFISEDRRDQNIIGLVVTTPLKQQICRYLDFRTDLVAFLGAANCVRFDGRSWIGANFDGLGFVRALKHVTTDFAEKSILLAGCGAAGSAIAAELVRSGARCLALYDTDWRKRLSLAARLHSFVAQCGARPVAELRGGFDVVVNATTLGMSREDSSPFPDEVVSASEIVADIVIGPVETRLHRQAASSGRTYMGGEAMVRGQGRLLYAFLLSEAQSELDVHERKVGLAGGRTLL